jgi:ABC-type lipoprotein release transport system permease subunit
MDLSELFREALRAIRTHALRSFLTLLGIVIGVATLVGVISVISGLNAFVRDKLFRLAPDVFVVSKYGIIRSREEFLDALKRPDIHWDDYLRLRTSLSKA